MSISGKSNHRNAFFLTVVFALILFASIDMASHIAFADMVTDTISVGAGPRGVAVNPDTNLIYVANSKDNTISVIDGANDTVLTTINSVADPDIVAVNPATNKIYATTSGDIVIIDGSTNTISGSIALGHHAYSVAVNPITNKIYAASVGIIEAIDGSTNTVIATIPQKYQSASALTVNPTTNLVYATHSASCQQCNYLSVIDGEIDSQINSIWLYCGWSPAVDPITNTVYVSQNCPSTVAAVDGNTNTVNATIKVGNGPFGIETNPNTGKVYVVNYWSNDVSIIDEATKTVIDTLQVGTAPVHIAINPSANKIYVSNFADNTVSVIEDNVHQSTTSTLTIQSTDLSGNSFDGMWVELWQNGQIVQAGPTPFSASVQSGGSYEVFANDWQNILFNHWEDDSTDARRAFAINEDTTFTAFYNTNNPPVAANDSAQTTLNKSVTINVLANDSDPDGDPLTIDSITSPAHGTVSINPDNTITYTPNFAYVGSDSFGYRISDGKGGTDTTVVSITVNAVAIPRFLILP